MEERLVYLFMGDNLVVPEEASTEEMFYGVSESAVLKAFAGSAFDFYELPFNDKTFIPCYMLNAGAIIPQNWRLKKIRELIIRIQITKPDKLAKRLVRAAHIMQWRETSVYCGSCGAKNEDSEIEVCRRCPRCGRHEYPRITPAIIVAVTNKNNEILLAHNRNFPPKLFSLIAGFNEAGETLEETVKRELREEVSVNVKNIRYKASQPWPFPASLMTAWTAAYSDGEIKCDGIEIEEAWWFSKSSLPVLPGLGSIARYLINQWLKH
ncbi:MAG: NAD(+) diphosphatase [Spirochaetaceae bacterium]|jgi:NAD+ diphosphatase|nr:NAD(+) diphosphatase [Spirochaetaceae bacterium]